MQEYTIYEFAKEMHRKVDAFKEFWLENCKSNPEYFQISIPKDNSGVILEQFNDWNA